MQVSVGHLGRSGCGGKAVARKGWVVPGSGPPFGPMRSLALRPPERRTIAK